jgi:hypothetical protein
MLNDVVTLLPNERLDCNVVPESGIHECTAAGVYTVTFDNSYSWFSSKSVTYKVDLKVHPSAPPDVDRDPSTE